MKTQFKRSFAKDLKRLQDKAVLNRVGEIIKSVERASDPGEIRNLRPMRTGRNYFRIRLGDYRLGLIIQGETVTFVRFLHRKEIYRNFP